MRVLPVIVGSPRYVARDSRMAPETRKAGEIEPYKCFVGALVRRYGRGGSFPRQNRGVGPITEWQVWNEPNVRSFSPNGTIEPREYARLLKITSTKIRGRDPEATMIAAGMPEFTQAASIHSFLRGFYGVPGIRRHFSALAIHPYAKTASGVRGALTRLRDTLQRLRDGRRVVWVTETGWSTHGISTCCPWARKTEEGQAMALKRTFRMLQSNRKRFKLGTVHWFRWRDTKNYSQRGNVFDFAGLFRRDGTVKPSCRAYVSFTGGRCARIAAPATAGVPLSASGGSISAEAAIEPSPAE